VLGREKPSRDKSHNVLGMENLVIIKAIMCSAGKNLVVIKAIMCSAWKT
jgi:hypothetical protein